MPAAEYAIPWALRCRPSACAPQAIRTDRIRGHPLRGELPQIQIAGVSDTSMTNVPLASLIQRLCCVLAVAAVLPRVAAADMKYISVPASATLAPGERYRVAVMTTEMFTSDNATGYQGALHYSTDLLQIDTTTYTHSSGAIVYRVGPGDMGVPTPLVQESEPGWLNFVAAGSAPITGSGTLFYFPFCVHNDTPDKSVASVWLSNSSYSLAPPHVPGAIPFYAESGTQSTYVPGVVWIRDSANPTPHRIDLPSEVTLTAPGACSIPIEAPMTAPWEPLASFSFRVEVPTSIFLAPSAQTASVTEGDIVAEGSLTVSYPQGGRYVDISWSGPSTEERGTIAVLNLTPRADLVYPASDSIRVLQIGATPILTATGAALAPVARNAHVTASYPTGAPIRCGVQPGIAATSPYGVEIPIDVLDVASWDSVSAVNVRLHLPQGVFQTPSASTVRITWGPLALTGQPTVSFLGGDSIDVAWAGTAGPGGGTIARIIAEARPELAYDAAPSIPVSAVGAQPVVIAHGVGLAPEPLSGTVNATYPVGEPIRCGVPADVAATSPYGVEIPINVVNVADWDSASAVNVRLHLPQSVFQAPSASTVSIAPGPLAQSGQPTVTFLGGDSIDVVWAGTAGPGGGTIARITAEARPDLTSDVTVSMPASAIGAQQIVVAAGVGLAPEPLIGTIEASYPVGTPIRCGVASAMTLRSPYGIEIPISILAVAAWDTVKAVRMKLHLPQTVFEAPTSSTVAVRGGTLALSGDPTLSFLGGDSIEVAWEGLANPGSGTIAYLSVAARPDLATGETDTLEVGPAGDSPLVVAAGTGLQPESRSAVIVATYPTGQPILLAGPADTALATSAAYTVPIRASHVAPWDTVKAFNLRIQAPATIFETPGASTVGVSAGEHVTSGNVSVTYPGGEFIDVSLSGNVSRGSGVLAYVTLTPRTDLTANATDSLRLTATPGQPLVVAGGVGIPPEAVSGRIEATYPTSVAMEQPREPDLLAWPNPFNGQVAIHFTGMDGPVAGAIYDTNGRLVRRWTSDDGGPWYWDGTDSAGRMLGSGVYIAIAQRGGVVRRMRVAFVR